MTIPNPFPIRPSGGAQEPQEPAILPATIPPEVLWYFERLVKYLNSKHHPNFFKGQDLYTDQKVMSYLHTMVVKMAKERSGGQEATNESTEEEHRASEGPTFDQEIKFRRSDLDEKDYMTRSGKRALVPPVPNIMTNWVNPIYCNKRREEARQNRGLEDEEKLNMTREGKWPIGRCSIVRMDQMLCMRCVRDKMKKGTDEYKYFMARGDAEKRNKQFLIRMG